MKNAKELTNQEINSNTYYSRPTHLIYSCLYTPRVRTKKNEHTAKTLAILSLVFF